MRENVLVVVVNHRDWNFDFLFDLFYFFNRFIIFNVFFKYFSGSSILDFLFLFELFLVQIEYFECFINEFRFFSFKFYSFFLDFWN